MTDLTPPTQLVDAARTGRAAVVDWVVANGGTPIRDDESGVFIYVGLGDEVQLHHWSDIYPEVPDFRQIDETGVWWTSVALPERTRLEYKLAIDNAHGELTLDPLNPHRARDPFGTNSVATGAGYERVFDAVRRSDVPRGRLVDLPIMSGVFDEVRRETLYIPHDHAGEPIPLVVVHDGSEYLNYADLAIVLDNLNVESPVAALLVDPCERLLEYGANDRHAEFLLTEAIPAAGRHVSANRLIAMGASFGGVASLHAAWANPGTFDALVLQSGSFVDALGGPFGRDERFTPAVSFVEALRAEPGNLPPTMHLSCGRFDGLIHDNRRMVEWFRSLAVDVGWDERPDGHTWGLWRDTAGVGLRHVLNMDPAG